MVAVAKVLGRIYALTVLVLAVVCSSAQAAYPGGNGWISFEGPEIYSVGPQIYVVRQDGSGVRRVTETMFIHRETRWSPDGRLLAIEGGNHYSVAWAIRAASLERSELVTEEIWASGGHSGAWGLPAWSGDGRRIAGVGWTETPYDPSRLFVTHTIGPTDQRAGGQPNVMHPNWNGRTPVWSPDGSLLAYDGCAPSDGSRCGIWTMRPDEPSSARLIVRSDGTFPVHHPDWSPDSQRIAYEVGHTGATGRGIHTVRRDGSEVRRISTGGYTPAYSPDGREIVFSQQNGLYVMAANGSNHRRIFSGANLEPDWQRVDVPVQPNIPVVPAPSPTPSTPPTLTQPTAPTHPPSPADADGDGVTDSYDGCPRITGDPSNRGCPSGTTAPPLPVNVVPSLPPSTPPSAGSQDLPRLTVREAKSAARRALAKEYGSRFKRRTSRGYQLTCRRLTNHRATCKVTWRHRGVRYRGTVKVARTADGLYVAPRVRRVSR